MIIVVILTVTINYYIYNYIYNERKTHGLSFTLSNSYIPIKLNEILAYIYHFIHNFLKSYQWPKLSYSTFDWQQSVIFGTFFETAVPAPIVITPW